jgi:hypothetical protein
MALRERRWTMKTSAAANTTTKTKDQKKERFKTLYKARSQTG